MPSPVHAIAGSMLVLVAACSCADRGLSIDGPEPTTSLGDASSDGDTDAATSGLSAGESTFGGAAGGETTAAPTTSSRARVLAYGTHGGVTALFYVEYADGVVTEPLPIATADPDEPLEGIVVSSSRAHASYRHATRSGDLTPRLVDLREGPPPPPVPLPIPRGTTPSDWLELVPGDGAVVFETDSGTPSRRSWVSTLADGLPQSPELVAGPFPEGWSMKPLREIAADGTWMLVELGPDDSSGPTNVYLTSLADPDPGALVQVSAVDVPGREAEDARILPGDTGVIYRARGETFARDLWYVQIDAGAPGPAVRVSEPLPPPRETWGVHAVHVLPSGDGVVYWTAQEIGDEVGEFYFVAIEDGVPSPAMLLGPPADVDAKPTLVFSSPDGRWVAYGAEDPVTEDRPLWLVDVSAGFPSPPFPVADVPNVVDARFDVTSTFLYYELVQSEHGSGLFRSDLSGPLPGPPQKVSDDSVDELGLSSGVTFSEDDSRVAYFAGAPFAELRVVDVSGAVPGAPLLTIDELDQVVDTQFSADGDALLLTVVSPQVDGARQLVLYDLLGHGPPQPMLDDAPFFRVLPD